MSRKQGAARENFAGIKPQSTPNSFAIKALIDLPLRTLTPSTLSEPFLIRATNFLLELKVTLVDHHFETNHIFHQLHAFARDPATRISIPSIDDEDLG